MRLKNSIALLAIVIIGCGLAGCGQVDPYIGQDSVIESSDRRSPKWVKNPPKPDRKTIYFVGVETSPDKTDSYAYQRALAQISQFINTRATALYTQESDNSVAQYRNEYIQTLSRASVRGALRQDSYWEYVVVKQSETAEDRFYRYYVLVGISKKDLLESEKATLEDQLALSDNDPVIQKALDRVRTALDEL